MNDKPSSVIHATPPQNEGAPPPATTAAPQQSRAREQAGLDSSNVNIAHLPKETRDMINLMLDDRLPYHILIDELGEAGQGLKPKNLADWVQGQYQEYLKNRDDIDRIKTQMEFAPDLIRQLGDGDPSLIYRACTKVAAIQILDAIMDYGDAALREMLQVNLASFLTICNTLCNMSDSTLKAEKHRIAVETANHSLKSE